jgi:hypothetical protein
MQPIHHVHHSYHTIPKMNGHKFQLLCESNRPDEFKETYEALRVYVLENFQFPEDMVGYFSDPMYKPTLDLPADTSASPSKKEIDIWREKMKECEMRSKTLQRNEKALFVLIMKCCSPKLEIRLRGRCNHLEEHRRANCMYLFNSIRSIIPCPDPKRDIFIELHEAKVQLYRCRQGEFQSLDHYLECYQGCVELVEHYKGSVGAHYSHVDEKNLDGVVLSIDERTTIARDRSMAIAFLQGACRTRYRRLIHDLKNQKHPTDLKLAYEMLRDYDPLRNFEM